MEGSDAIVAESDGMIMRWTVRACLALAAVSFPPLSPAQWTQQDAVTLALHYANDYWNSAPEGTTARAWNTSHPNCNVGGGDTCSAHAPYYYARYGDVQAFTERGVPYAFNLCDEPSEIQAAIDAGQSAGSTRCHCERDGGCSRNGVPTWATGVDCSGLVGAVTRIGCVGTCTLMERSTPIDPLRVGYGDFLVKCGVHAVFVFHVGSPGTVSIIEADGRAHVHRVMKAWDVDVDYFFNQG